MKKILVKYDSNNSGGSWWLTDEDWKKLEKAGWYVIWGGLEFCHSSYEPKKKPVCVSNKSCHGHRKYTSWKKADKDKYLGALATSAQKKFTSIKEALEEFESVTGQSVTDKGCNCCGAPHSFEWDGNNETNRESGEGLSEHLLGTDLE